MKRSPNDTVRNYIRRLSDADLDFIRSRLTENFAGDLACCLDFLQKSPDIDRLLQFTQTVDDFYSVIDLIQDAAWSECGRRQNADRHARV